ncbi:MAG: hypothetical protein N2115_07260 [bacterium]|nr:hypothetical protein [bacterium]
MAKAVFSWGTFKNVFQSRYIAQIEGLKIFCGLAIYKKIYKRFPDKLQQLVPDILAAIPLDPFTGKDFVYKKQNDKILVYSTGPNLIDDEGIKNSEKGKDDIVWKN